MTGPFDDGADMLPSGNAGQLFRGSAANASPGVASPHGAVRAPDEGAHTMGDKSPKQSNVKKPHGKSIKEKRLEKKAKTDHSSQMDNLTHGRK
jgi:hypothetical protein